jgi:RNA polymerase sigma factor (sigma-70 family)
MGATAVRGEQRRVVRLRASARHTDSELAARVRNGDDAAFEAIYDRYHRGLLAFCRHMLGSREEAEDALQVSLVSAYRALRSGRDDVDTLKPWLYAIARNRCISVLRARREEPVGDQPDHPSGPFDGLGEQVQRRADLRELVLEVQRLPEEQRAALVLFELGDQSHDEIAKVLGVRREKVKALVFQAREALLRAQNAREMPCGEIREHLATEAGKVPRRSAIRAHLDRCDACAAYETQVRRQRAALAAIMPLAPTLGLKASVLGSVLGGGAASGGGGGAAVTGGGAAAAGGAGAGGAAAAGGGAGTTAGTAGALGAAGATTSTAGVSAVAGGATVAGLGGAAVTGLATAGAGGAAGVASGLGGVAVPAVVAKVLTAAAVAGGVGSAGVVAAHEADRLGSIVPALTSPQSATTPAPTTAALPGSAGLAPVSGGGLATIPTTPAGTGGANTARPVTITVSPSGAIVVQPSAAGTATTPGTAPADPGSTPAASSPPPGTATAPPPGTETTGNAPGEPAGNAPADESSTPPSDDPAPEPSTPSDEAPPKVNAPTGILEIPAEEEPPAAEEPPPATTTGSSHTPPADPPAPPAEEAPPAAPEAPAPEAADPPPAPPPAEEGVTTTVTTP